MAKRTVEDIERSGIAGLMNNEASHFVPLSGNTLLRRYHEGRLTAGGRPLTVRIPHLIDQHLAGYPKVEQKSAAA